NCYEAHFLLIIIYGHTGLLEGSIRHARKALELFRESKLAKLNEGLSLLWNGDPLQALGLWPEDYSPVASRGENSWIPVFHAAALYALGKTNEALVEIKACEETPLPGGQSFADRSGLLGAVKALFLANSGDWTGAKAEIEKASVKEPNDYAEFHHASYYI